MGIRHSCIRWGWAIGAMIGLSSSYAFGAAQLPGDPDTHTGNPNLEVRDPRQLGVNRPGDLPPAKRKRTGQKAGQVQLPPDRMHPVDRAVNIPGTTDLPDAPGTSNPPGASNSTPGTPGNPFATGGIPLRPRVR